MSRMRLDQTMVERGLAEDLDLARALIMEGRVYIFEEKADKPSRTVQETDQLSVRGERNAFVSRGGHKLDKAMKVFHIDAQDRVCVDIGSSTGGFTDVLLRAGARKVYAVDVGYGLLDWKLRSDERVCVMERTNARRIQPAQFDPRPSFGVTDVSFISLKAVLPAAFACIEGPGRRFVALIKPQFEARSEQVGKKGVVRDPEVHFEVIRGIVDFLPGLGWRAQGLSYSPITGPEGNIEFLLDIRPEEEAGAAVENEQILEVMKQAYDNFIKY